MVTGLSFSRLQSNNPNHGLRPVVPTNWQLQARELLASQRQAARAKVTPRREEAKRRGQLADLVFLAGAETLDDGDFLVRY